MRRSASYISRKVLLVVTIALQASFARPQNNLNVVDRPRAFNQLSVKEERSVPQKTSEAMKQPGVSLAGGELTIVAENTFLSEILRQVAETNGIIITGTISDEPVFGTYGPDEISAVISALLQGTGTNLLFSAGSSNSSRLILTPRTGTNNLVSRRAIAYGGPVGARPDFSGGSSNHPPAELPERDQNNKQPPLVPTSLPGAPPATAGAVPTMPRSPNGVKTPEEIQAQLIRLNEGAVSTRQGSANPADNRL